MFGKSNQQKQYTINLHFLIFIKIKIPDNIIIKTQTAKLVWFSSYLIVDVIQRTISHSNIVLPEEKQDITISQRQ